MNTIHLSHHHSTSDCECCGSQDYHTVLAQINGVDDFELYSDTHFGGNWNDNNGQLYLLCLDKLNYHFIYRMHLKNTQGQYDLVDNLEDEDPSYHFEQTFYFGEDNSYVIPNQDKNYTFIQVDLFYGTFSYRQETFVNDSIENKTDSYHLVTAAKLTMPDNQIVDLDLSTSNHYEPIFETALNMLCKMSNEHHHDDD